VILADQVKNLDWRVRQAEFICKLPPETTSLPRADKSFTATTQRWCCRLTAS